MAAPQNAGIPDSLDLGGGYILEFTALDATAGTDVTAVKVSLATLTVDNVSDGGGQAVIDITEATIAPVAPLWAPLPTGVDADTAPAQAEPVADTSGGSALPA